MLAVHLVLLRRTLAPLRVLTEMMGTIDARRPGRRSPPLPPHTAELVALAGAFNAMLDRLEAERRDSARRALAAQEEERLRIAREMHDQIGQTLTALTIQAERAAGADGPVDREVLERLARAALESLEDVRRIGRELRPEALDDLGLGNALIALCRRTSAQSGLRVSHELARGLPPLRPEVELVVYRVAQEAVTNALRHARASQSPCRCARPTTASSSSSATTGGAPRGRSRRHRRAQRHARAGAARRRRLGPESDRWQGTRCACPSPFEEAVR